MGNLNHFESTAPNLGGLCLLLSHAKDCLGVSTLLLQESDDPKRAFPISDVHVQLGLCEKFVDRLARKLLGGEIFRKIES